MKKKLVPLECVFFPIFFSADIYFFQVFEKVKIDKNREIKSIGEALRVSKQLIARSMLTIFNSSITGALANQC